MPTKKDCFCLFPDRKVKGQTKKLGEITARLRHTEQILHTSEEKYRQLVENADCIILRMDQNGNITFFNEFAQKFFGYSEREILGKNVVGTIVPTIDKSGRNCSKIEKVMRQHPERYIARESENICKNGRRVWVVWANKIIRDKQKKITEILCVGHDITQRRQLEKDILEITERERKLIGQEMHDSIGQVLTGVAIKSKGLAMKLKGQSIRHSKDAEAISKLASQAIAQMRNLARMLYPVDIEAGGLVTALQSLASNAEKILDINCRFRCETPVSMNDLVEAKQLYRIAQEAVTNAAKHGKAKNVTIELHSTADLCILSVTNDGLSFQRSSRPKGGLGLKIMEYRANLIGGVLEIGKGKKKGAVVTCTVANKTETS
jgi:PAS domain S-box-containing protein